MEEDLSDELSVMDENQANSDSDEESSSLFSNSSDEYDDDSITEESLTFHLFVRSLDDEDDNNDDDDHSTLSVMSAMAVVSGGVGSENRMMSQRLLPYSSRQHCHHEITPAISIIDQEGVIFLEGRVIKRRKTGKDNPLTVSSAAETNLHRVHFQDLPQLMQLAVLQFLDVKSLVAVRQVDRSLRDLLQSYHPETLDIIWKPACQRRWPWMTGLKEKRLTTRRQQGEDFARLLTWAAKGTQSHSVDGSRFPRFVQFTDNSCTTIKYTGSVGPSDRCIRANAPLPRPSSTIMVRTLHSNFQQPISQWEPYREEWKPFVAPYAPTTASYCLKPRLVSYFEVTLLPRDSNDTSPDHQNNNGRQQTQSDCVAIGLATENFNLRGRMPGWDRHSFGYHGDDGRYYHGDGWPRDDLIGGLPTFGDGDCVGCGISWLKESIFFCKNGEFLGYAQALSEQQLLQNWYPVVGLDSRCPVKVNFGLTPFRFDLAQIDG